MESHAEFAHILTDEVPISTGTAIHRQIIEVLTHRYNITHATLQLECAGCFPDSLYCELNDHVHMQDVWHSTHPGH